MSVPSAVCSVGYCPKSSGQRNMRHAGIRVIPVEEFESQTRHAPSSHQDAAKFPLRSFGASCLFQISLSSAIMRQDPGPSGPSHMRQNRPLIWTYQMTGRIKCRSERRKSVYSKPFVVRSCPNFLQLTLTKRFHPSSYGPLTRPITSTTASVGRSLTFCGVA